MSAGHNGMMLRRFALLECLKERASRLSQYIVGPSALPPPSAGAPRPPRTFEQWSPHCQGSAEQRPVVVPGEDGSTKNDPQSAGKQGGHEDRARPQPGKNSLQFLRLLTSCRDGDCTVTP